MPFNYRDQSNLADRLRGKSGEEILNELSGLNTQRRMFFDSPSWRRRQSNSAFPRGFPFNDDQNRINIRTCLNDIASRHPEFADQLKDRSWDEDFVDPLVARTENLKTEFQERKDAGCEASGSEQQLSEVQESGYNLTNFGLRNTVPLCPRVNSAQERHQRSMSAPPENRGANKRFVTKCEIPLMNNPTQDAVQIKSDLAGKGPQESNLQKANNAPNVRVIPIQVEGRDTPLVNTNIDTSTNFGAESFVEPSFEGRLPREFGSYQKHSPRFTHKERAPTPPQYQYAPQYQQYVPPSQHFMPSQKPQFMHQQHFAPPEQQTFLHQQERPQKPAVLPSFHQQQLQEERQPPQQPQDYTVHGPKLPQRDETDSRKSESIKDPVDKVQAIQKEVDELMKQVEAFKGNSRTDKQYLMLDELLTRQLLLLDNIDTEGKDNVRQARKDTIRSIQRCISKLENKVPLPENNELTNELKPNQEKEESVELDSQQPMEIENPKKNKEIPPGNRETQNMEVDEKISGESQSNQNPQQEQHSDQEEKKEKI